MDYHHGAFAMRCARDGWTVTPPPPAGAVAGCSQARFLRQTLVWLSVSRVHTDCPMIGLVRQQRFSKQRSTDYHKDGCRRQKRFEKHVLLICPLGPLIDLSVTSMRVSCCEKHPVTVGQQLDFSIQSDQDQLRLSGRITWIRRKGIRTR